MTTILPELSDVQLAELPSQAEAKVYRALRDGLSKDFVVLFEVGWILRREEEKAHDGETDFLVCHPTLGYVCIEVKGGGVAFDAATGDWYSVDRHRQKHAINNPIHQALKAKYAIRSKLNEHQRWRDLSLGNVVRGHAVFFPDIGDANALSRPDMPATVIGASGGVAKWLVGAYDDHYVRKSGVWMFQSLKFRINFYTPHLESWAATAVL